MSGVGARGSEVRGWARNIEGNLSIAHRISLAVQRAIHAYKVGTRSVSNAWVLLRGLQLKAASAARAGSSSTAPWFTVGLAKSASEAVPIHLKSRLDGVLEVATHIDGRAPSVTPNKPWRRLIRRGLKPNKKTYRTMA
jgi:hypothetical protein